MYRKRDTGEVFKLHSEIRSAYPNPTLPAIITDEVLDEVGYDVVTSENPTFNGDTEKVVDGVLEEVGGVWTQRKVVEPLTVEEKKARVPTSVTRRQARQALMLAGYLEQVAEKISLITNPIHRQMAMIEWEDSQVFERNRPLVIQIGLALGLDEAGLDNIFKQAGKL